MNSMNRVPMWVENAQTRSRKTKRLYPSKSIGQAIFAKELARGIDLESYRAEVLVDKNFSHQAKATTAPVSMMADPLEMQSSGEEDELQPSKQMKPKYHKRTARSKQFEQSLKLAKRARLTLDGVLDVSETQKVFESNDNGNIRDRGSTCM